MADLNLGSCPRTDVEARISAEKAISLYAETMDTIARLREKQAALKSKNEETLPKKIEKLKGTSPQDLLDANFVSVSGQGSQEACPE